MDEHSQAPQPKLAAQDHRLGAHEPWLVHVDVYLEDDTTTPPQFRIESCLPGEPRNGERYLVFENHYRPGFRIMFQLHDLTEQGYTFPRSANEAVWSKRGNDCPGEDWAKNDVFAPRWVIEPDLTELVVDFANGRDEKGEPVGDFRYTLNVTKKGGQLLHLDPGGTGMNGDTLMR